MSSPAGWSTSSSSKAALFVLGCFALLVAACGGGGDKGIAISTAAPSSAGPPDARTPIGMPPALPTQPPVQPVAGGEAVAFQSADASVTMRGNLFAAPGAKRKALIIASQLPDLEPAWQPWARELAGAGIATLTFQMPQYKDLGGQRDIAQMDRDLESAVLFLESRDYPLIYVIGDNTAGTAAVKLAARHKLAGVITVASPVAFGTPVFDARADAGKVTVPKLFLASQDQAGMTQDLMKAAAEPKQSSVLKGPPGSGIVLLNGADGATFKQTVRDFVLK